MKREKKYWLDKFSGELPVLNLPTDYPRPNKPIHKGESLAFELDNLLTSKVKQLATETNTTLYMVLMSAVNILFARYSGQEDIVVGSPITGRNYARTENLIGMFVNTLAIRNHPTGEKNYRQFLSEVKANTFEAYNNQDYQFEDLIDDLDLRRDFSRNPLFDIMFVNQDKSHVEEMKMADFKVKPFKQDSQTAKFDITIFASEKEDQIIFNLEYKSQLFKKETIRRMLSHLENILRGITAEEEIRLNQIEILDQEEKELIVEDFNNTERKYPADKTIKEIFEEEVKKNPNKLAVVFEREKITYRQLNERANRLARTLRKKGVKADRLVGIITTKSVEMMVGLMAILKAGGAYLPIDPKYPEDRKLLMLEDGGVDILLTVGQSGIENQADYHVIDITDQRVYASENHNLDELSSAEDLAYVIYTSGSTGQPKGVMIEQKSVVRLVKNTNYIEFGPEDKILQTGTLAFDASTFEIWGALLNGLELHLAEQDIILNHIKMEKYIEENGISIVWLTAPLFNVMAAEKPKMFKGLRYLLIGGDVLSPNHVNLVLDECKELTLINGYGPTENTTFSTCFEIDGQYEQHIPIGRPISNSTAYIVDQYNQLAPVGVYGELYVGGDGLARGYLNNQELTSEKFVEHPFLSQEILYKTGDLARWSADGNIEFAGRVDHQVKIRGFRIEPGEIENCILEHHSVKEAVVVDWTDEKGNKYLAAYLLLTADGGQDDELTALDIKEYLSQELPDYMIPSYITVLDEMPYNLNGKVDRQALPEPEGNLLRELDYQPPETKLEEELARIWSLVLGVKKIGRNNNFFDLGGHSLKGITCVSRIFEKLNVAIPLRVFFKSPTIKDIATYIENADQSENIQIQPIGKQDYYPLSSAQKRMFLVSNLQDNDIAYNIPTAFYIKGELDRTRFNIAIQKLIERYESLRTSFELKNGQAVQVIHDQVDFAIEEFVADEAEIDQVIDSFIRPFDLDQAPLFRVGLVKLENKHLLIFDIHHIVSDGRSMEIIINDFIKVYQGQQLEELDIQYKEYAAWQNQFFASDKINSQEEFWLDTFDQIPILDLPLDYNRPAKLNYSGGRVQLEIDELITDKLIKLANEKKSTLFNLLLAAYNILLAKYSGQDDLVVGTPIEGRTRPEFRNIVGMFVNTLALRNQPRDDYTFLEFFDVVRRGTQQAFENQDYQFEMLVDKLDIEGQLNRNPLFDAMFTLQKRNSSIAVDSALEFSPYTFDSKTSKFDISLNCVETEQGSINISFVYSKQLFKEETIKRMSNHFLNLITEIVDNPETRLSNINLISDQEKNQILTSFNDTKVNYPRNKTIKQIFEEQVELYPDQIAVVFEGRSLTYDKLNRKANRLARTLVKKGVKEDKLVGIITSKSLEMMVGVLAILKAGGAYLPIDLNYPKDRIRIIMKESELDLLLTSIPIEIDYDLGCTLVNISDPNVYAQEDVNLEESSSPQGLAYVIYTSGSSGQPKGVMIEQKSVVRLVKNTNYINFVPEDKILQTGTLAFDASTFEIWGALLNGVELHFADQDIILRINEMKRYILENGISIMWLTAPLFNVIADESPETFKRLRYLLIGGDVLSPKHVNLVLDECENLNIINGYGPTENTTFSTYFEIDGEYDNDIPIGKPINNSTAYILDKNNLLVPIGVSGELSLGGDGLARGYLNDPELTREKFVDNPYLPGKKIYKSGDLARWTSDGNIEFLGRMDHQVKIRGFRIEISEIEKSLLEHEQIKEAIVVDRKDAEGNKILIAYLVPNKDMAEEDRVAGLGLKRFLSRKLPEYMLPSYFIMVKKMPYNINGKIDRQALPEPDEEMLTKFEFKTPVTKLEEKLAEIWTQVLGVKKIGRNNNFFNLGGNSLKVMTCISRVYKELGLEIPLGDFYKAPTIKEIASYIEETNNSQYLELKPVPEHDYYPLSSAQKRMYLINQLQEEGTAYNIPGAFYLEGNLDRDQLNLVVEGLIRRYESLRTSFELKGGQLVQIVHDQIDYQIEEIEADESEIDKVIDTFIRPHNLTQPPLFRIGLVQLADDRYLLIFDIHHIISDGRSMEIMIKDFMKLYQGQQLEELEIQYKDFAIWQNQLFASDQIANQEKYWINTFEQIPVLELPLDYPRPTKLNLKGEQVKVELDKVTTDKLNQMAQHNHSTLFNVMIAAYNILLAKYSGQKDIVVGTPIEGRSRPQLRDVMGMFVNTLALRNQLKGDYTFRQFLEVVHQVNKEAFSNQDYQFEMLVDKLNIERKLNRNPLFDTMFTLQSRKSETVEGTNLQFRPYNFDSKTSKFDISLNGVETNHGLDIAFTYSTQLFKRETIERMASHYLNLIREIVTNPVIKLEDIQLISADEREELLYEFNDTRADYPIEKTIHQLFEEQVSRTPEKIALHFGREDMTYQELEARSNQLAHELRSQGLGIDDRVGLMVERSFEMIVGMLAILKAGAGYVPIDPGYPIHRIEYMLADSQAKLLLTGPTITEELDFAGKILNIQDKSLYQGPTTSLENINTADHLAYIIYTSGSTGKPKGVMIEHGSVVNKLNWSRKEYPFTDDDLLLQKTPFVFDVSVWTIFWSLTYGGSLYLLRPGGEKNPALIANTIDRAKISMIHFVPSMLNAFLEYIEQAGPAVKEKLESLRQVFVGGEAFYRSQLERVREYFGDEIGLTNYYGPTEATIDVTYYHCTELDKINSHIVSIGRPIDNTRIYILDENDDVQPVGVYGELCVAGRGLARGYLNRQDLTDKKFVSDPFVPGEKMYRTGDIARWLPDGIIEFQRRKDNQVKVRGFRIELGEIETALLNHQTIKEAAVVAETDDNNSRSLTGYITTKSLLSISDLKEHLATYLPDYMIPQQFRIIEKMPLTVSGKIDRKALKRNMGSNIDLDSEYQPPTNPIEETLVELWKEILHVGGQIGVNDNFFNLGGHSLKAITFITRVYEVLDVELELKEIFRTPTIRHLANVIEKKEKSDKNVIKPIEEQLYYPLSSAQKRIYLLNRLQNKGTVYNIPGAFSIQGQVDRDRLRKALTKLIERHESLRTSFQLRNNQPVQVIEEEVTLDIEEINAHQSELNQVVHSFIRPFDLDKPPLFRVGLIDVGDRYILIFDIHHIISDGTSMQIIMNEFIRLYHGEELKDLKIQYKDFANWQNQLFESDEIKEQEEYWLEQFDKDIPVLDLPTDYPRPAISTFEGGNIRFELGEELTDKLNQLAIDNQATLFMVLLSAYNIMLAKYTGQSDIVIGTPIAGRNYPGLDNIVGMFVNTLALRNYPESELEYSQFLEELRSRTLQAFSNQDYQFEMLVDKLGLERELGSNPLFDTMFVLQNVERKESKSELAFKPHRLENEIAKFDLTLSVMEGRGKLYFTLEYRTDLYRQDTVERMADHYINILGEIVANQNLKLAELDMISEQEKQLLLNEFNNTTVQYPNGKLVHQLIEERAANYGSQRALVLDNRSLSYCQLNQRANQLAHYLRRSGAEKKQVIGILVEESFEMFIGLLAILKAGSSYLPIAADYPADRIEYMLTNSESNILLTQGQLLEKIELEFSGQIVDLDNTGIYQGSTDNLDISNGLDDLAYLIYTSGSTGQPKGVMVEHSSLLNLVNWHCDQYQITPEDKSTKYAGFGFDASVWEIFPYLISGAEIHILSEELRLDLFRLNKYIEDNEVTISFLPTPVCEQFIKLDNNSLKYLLTGGDKLNNFVENKYQLINHYGPTENTVVTTSYQVNSLVDNIPIGRPIANNRVYILDDKEQLQPIGVPGELCIGGQGLARGYINLPEKTEDSFRPDPYQRGQRIYKTGDLARWKADGNLEFLGRIDNQVQIRGHRIELGEIESKILTHQLIDQTVVTVNRDNREQKYLAAYLVFADDKSELIEVESIPVKMKKYLSESLPGYMVPVTFTQLDELPLTANGKVDKTALPEPEGFEREEYQAPENSIEGKLAEIWSQIIGLEKISRKDNFFSLGGNSLSAIQLMSSIHKEMNVELSLTQIFKTPTIVGLADIIQNTAKTDFSEIEPTVVRDSYPLSSAQKRMFLVNQISGKSTAYNIPGAFYIEGELDRTKLSRAINKLVERHESLRTFFKLIDEEPVQIIKEQVDLEIEEITADADQLGQIIQQFIRPFDLEQEPLFRVGLVELIDKSLLIFDMHHIIADGKSMQIIINEVMGFYHGEKMGELEIQYKDFAVWQNRLFESDEIKDQEKYWLDQFDNDIPVLDLPTDYSRPAISNFGGDSIRFELGKELTDKLNQIAIDNQTTLFMVLLSAYNIMLAKYTGQSDIVVGTPIAGRNYPGLDNIIGMFVNTLALRNYPNGDKEYQAFLEQVSHETIQAFSNQDYQFEMLVDKLDLDRDLGSNPLFNTMFVLQNVGRKNISSDDLTFKPYHFKNDVAKFDLTLSGTEGGGKIYFTLEYRTDLYRKNTIERMAEHFINIIEQITVNQELKLAEIDIVSKEEKELLLKEFNDTAMEYNGNGLLHQLIEERVFKDKDKIALVKGDDTLSYEQLNQRANQLARYLRSKGARRDQVIGLMVEDSFEMFIGILAILKAGSAYLAIDPDFPAARIEYMTTDSERSMRVTQG